MKRTTSIPLRLLALAIAFGGAALGRTVAVHAADAVPVAQLAKETHFHGISVDAADSSRLYLATHHGLYVASLDGTAERISEVRDYMGFTPHPTDPAVLYASGHPPGGGNLGFIASQDGGRTWSKLSNGIGGPVDFHEMDVSKADPRVIYGVYGTVQRSANGGMTWMAMGRPPDGLIAIAASAIDASTLYAATEGGIQKSTDGGKSWKRLTDKTTTMLHVTRDGGLYAFVAGEGLMRATEQDLAWTSVSNGFGRDLVMHFAADPRDAKRLYAITLDPRSHAQSIIASRDGGQSWTGLAGR